MNRFAKLLIWLVALLLILLLIISAALPTWLSSTSGKDWFLKAINRSLGERKLSIEKIELSWLGSQHMEGILLVDGKGTVLLSCKKFETETRLIDLLLGTHHLQKTLIDTPYLYLYEKEIQAESMKKQKQHREKHLKRLQRVRGPLCISEGSLVLAPQGMASIAFSDIEIRKENEQLLLSAFSQQETSRGKLEIQATLTDTIEAHLLLQEFPLALLNVLTESPLYTQAFGETLNAQLDLNWNTPPPCREGRSRNHSHCFYLQGVAQSAHFSAFIKGKAEGPFFQLSPESKLELTVTPTLFKELLSQLGAKNAESDWALASNTTLSFYIDKGSIPLFLKRMDLRKMTLQGHGQLERAELSHKTQGCYSLKQVEVSVIAQHNVEMRLQAELQGKEKTQLLTHLSIAPGGSHLFHYTCSGFPTAFLEMVSEPSAQAVDRLVGSQFDLEGEGSWISKEEGSGWLDTHFHLIAPQLDAVGRMHGDPADLEIQLTALRTLSGRAAELFGSAFDLQAAGHLQVRDKQILLPILEGKLSNPYFECIFTGTLKGQPPETTDKKRHPLSLEQLQLIINGTLKELPFEKQGPHKGLEGASFYAQLEGPKNFLLMKISSKAIEGRCELYNFFQEEQLTWEKARLLFECELNDFPVDTLTPFFSETLDLPLLIGESLSLKAEGAYQAEQEPRLSLDLSAQGKGFSSTVAIALDGTLTVRQNKPSFLSWQLTPERYVWLVSRLSPLKETPPFSLVEPTTLELHISQLICPTTAFHTLSHFFCQSGFTGAFQSQPWIFKNPLTNEHVVIEELKGKIEGTNFSEALQLQLYGEILAATLPTSEKSFFSFKGEIHHLFSPEGKIQPKALAFKGDLHLQYLPVHALLGVTPFTQASRECIEAILGPMVNAHMGAEIAQATGPLTIDISASNFKASVPLFLGPDALYLRAAIDTELTLTDAINSTLLQEMNPVFLTGAYSEHPIKVHIDPEGFLIPLHPYSLEAVTIGRAILDLGKIAIRNGGQIQGLMHFLKAEEVSPEGWMEAWFTPILLNIHQGVVSYPRFDALLAGSVHVALWGSVDLINNGIRMTLGITPATLKKRFKIKGLSKNELFQVKMYGSTHHLQLDWNAASTRLAFLVARTAGGHLGTLVGGILEQLIPAFGEEPAPPPTFPFPWERGSG